jgi:uncharacterized protein (DUF2252 family)
VDATLDERAARGRAARAALPRTAQAALDAVSDRDAVALVESQNTTRLPELVPLRRERMAATPFGFLRGAAVVMARDLASQPNTGLRVQLCGDAHLANFGGFASPERDLVFDLNDFDETYPGPFEWDVKRLATSVEIAGRERGFDANERVAAVLACVRSYRDAMRAFAAQGDLAVWYARLDAKEMLDALRGEHDASAAKRLSRAVDQARANDGRRALSKLTERDDGRLRFVTEPPLVVPLRTLEPDGAESVIDAMLVRYRRSLQSDRRVLLDRFRRVDVARKVVGVSSVGTRCWILLMLGRDESDPLLLQLKEAGPSVLEHGPGAAHGRRIVDGQRLLQAASDIFLGWTRSDTHDYYVRQLHDWKGSADLATILPQELVRYAGACGWTLARAHARSGDRVAIAAYLGGSDRFDRAIAEFAAVYADVNERDYRAYHRYAASRSSS